MAFRVWRMGANAAVVETVATAFPLRAVRMALAQFGAGKFATDQTIKLLQPIRINVRYHILGANLWLCASAMLFVKKTCAPLCAVVPTNQAMFTRVWGANRNAVSVYRSRETLSATRLQPLSICAGLNSQQIGLSCGFETSKFFDLPLAYAN